MVRVSNAFQAKVLSNSKDTGIGKPVSDTEKGIITVDKCTNTFTSKMEFTMRIVPNELSKIDRYNKGLTW